MLNPVSTASIILWMAMSKTQKITKLVEGSYGNSIENFIAAFTCGKKLSEEDAERLRKLI